MPKIYTVNAFTANGRHGNPAGVVLDTTGLTEKAMQTLAAEVGLSETAYVCNSRIATKRVRFFTPTVEVPLCGHATIATWSLLRQQGLAPAGFYTQETDAGVLKVEVTDDNVVFMEQTPATFYDSIAPEAIAALLGISPTDFDDRLSPQIVSTGIRDLLVPVKDKAVLAAIVPDLTGIAAYSRQQDVSGFHVFAVLPEASGSIASARNFAPADGIPEECATGTSNGALLCLLSHTGLLPQRPIYRIEQGESMQRLSYIYGTFKGDTVWIGGEATIQ